MRFTILIFIFISRGAFAAPVAPVMPNGSEGGLSLRVFDQQGPVSWYGETSAINETDGRDYREVLLGGYYLANPHLKLGAFYRRASGLRHNDDWIAINKVWQWANTNSRGEDFLVLDATPKMMASFLPGENWVAELKTRMLFNSSNGEQTVMLRPGLTYFLLKEGRAFWNFFFQYEMDMPANDRPLPFNEKWTYVGAIYQLSPKVEIGGFAASKWEAWSSSAPYLAKNGTPYTSESQSNVFSLIGIFQIE